MTIERGAASASASASFSHSSSSAAAAAASSRDVDDDASSPTVIASYAVDACEEARRVVARLTLENDALRRRLVAEEEAGKRIIRRHRPHRPRRPRTRARTTRDDGSARRWTDGAIATRSRARARKFRD